MSSQKHSSIQVTYIHSSRTPLPAPPKEVDSQQSNTEEEGSTLSEAEYIKLIEDERAKYAEAKKTISKLVNKVCVDACGCLCSCVVVNHVMLLHNVMILIISFSYKMTKRIYNKRESTIVGRLLPCSPYIRVRLRTCLNNFKTTRRCGRQNNVRDWKC